MARHIFLVIKSGIIAISELHRCTSQVQVSGVILPFKYTNLTSKEFSKTILELGQDNCLGPGILVDPSLNSVGCLLTLEVWRAKTQWAGSPRKVPPVTAFLGKDWP